MLGRFGGVIPALTFMLLTVASVGRVYAAAPGSLCNTPSVAGCAGATALPVFNPTHYALEVGTTITSKIIGATDLTGTEMCSAGGSGVDVIWKCSDLI